MSIHKNITKNLYDAALSPTAWSKTLDSLCPMMGARSAAILVEDTLTDQNLKPYAASRLSSNFDASIMEEYVSKYAFHEREHALSTFDAAPGVMVTDPAFADRDTYIRRPDVAFLHKHFGFVDRIGIRLNAVKEYRDCLAFQYSPERSVSNAAEFKLFQPYLPHLAQAVASSRLYDSIRLRYQAVLAVLDRVNVGLLLVRPNGNIIISNQTADEIIFDSPWIKLSKEGYLELKDSGSQVLLKKAIDEISSTASGQGNDTKRLIMAAGPSDVNNILLEVTPLRDSEIELEKGFYGALIMLVDPNREAVSNINALTLLYSLTPAESEIAEMISAGKSNKDIADERTVSPDTIKSQIKSLYLKTQSTNRAGLMRRLISIALPFND